MTPQLTIIADDLTGAGDAAVQFCQAGWTTELGLRATHPCCGDGAEVVAISTDSRARPEAEAAARIRSTTEEVVNTGARRLYKKIDSTLRGPLRAEIAALLDALGPDAMAVVCPAFPAMGRTLVNGTLLVHGQPVAETAAAHDPVTPVPHSHLPTLLDAPLIRLDPDGDPAGWARQARAVGRIVVVDAAEDSDLERVARLVTELGERAVPVGSAGLAGPLARRWRSPAGTALVVVTTSHEATRAQADVLSARGAPRHQPSSRELLDGSAWSAFTAAVLAGAARQPRTLLLSAPERDEDELPPELVTERLADLAVRVVTTSDITGLVLTGGDGARAVLGGLGCTGIRLHGQVVAGVPLGTVIGGPVAGLPVATKAGGFGEPDVLIAAAEAVERTRSSR